jgi:hypothetical protein
VTASINEAGTQIAIDWTQNQYWWASVTFVVERSVNGGAWTVVAPSLDYTTTGWVDTAPGGGSNQYRVKAVATGLSSGYGTSNTVTTIVPPLAPTGLSPNGSTVDLANTAVTLKWTHNPGTDGAKQSHFTIEYSSNGGSSWSTLANNIASTVAQYAIPAGTLANATYLWRVRTQGSTGAAYGPNSANATLIGSSTPTVTIDTDQLGPTTTSLPLSVTWAYNQDEGSAQASWEAVLYAADGVTQLEFQSGSGTTDTATFTYPVADQNGYVVAVRAKSAAGIWSDWATASTFVELPVPAGATITPTYLECFGATTLHIEPDEPALIGADRENLVTNPAFRTLSAGSPVEVRRNYIPNPAFRATSGTVEARRNRALNPSYRLTSGTVTVRTNLGVNPSSESGAWPSNNGTTYPTSLDTAVKRSGTQSTKSTPVVGIPVLMSIFNVGGGPQPCSPGETVTASVYVAHNAPVTAAATLTISFLDASSAVVQSVNGATVTGIVGNSQFTARPYHTAVAPAGTTQVRVIVAVSRSTGNTSAGEFAWADDAVLEKVAVPLPYFDGNTPASDGLTYAWTGTAGASSSTATGANSYAGSFKGYARKSWHVTGVASDGSDTALSYISADSTNSLLLFSQDAPAAAANDVVGGRFRVRLRNATADLAITPYVWAYTSASAGIGSVSTAGVITVPATGEWVDVAIPGGVCPANTAQARIYVQAPTAASRTDIIEVSNVLVEKLGTPTTTGPLPGPFFDGSTAAGREDGMTYSWTGTANASESIASGIAATGWQSVVSPGYISSEMVGPSGSPAVRLDWKDGPAFSALYGGVTVTGLTVGTSYTFSAEFWVPAGSEVVQPVVRVSGIASGNTVTAAQTDQWVVSTVTFVATATSHNFHAVTTPVPSIYGKYLYIADVMLEQTAARRDYFDGSMDSPEEGLTYSWVGTPDASASIATGVKAVGYAHNDPTYFRPWAIPDPEGIGNFERIIIAPSNTSPSAPFLSISPRIVASDGMTVRFSFDARSYGPTPGRGLRVVLYPVDSNGLLMSPFAVTVINTPMTEDWTRYSGQITLPAGAVSMSPYMYPGSGAGWLNGVDGIDIRRFVVEEPTTADISYFDGSSASTPTMTFDWSGTPDASTSLGTARAELPVDSVTVERSVEGGEWVTLVSNLAVPNDFIDTLPITNGLNSYRITTVSSAPSYRIMDAVDVMGTDGQRGSGDWVFLAYGDAFQQVLRFHGDPAISESAGRTRAAPSFLGRKRPVLLVGANSSRVVKAAGSLRWEEWCVEGDECKYDSPVSDWADAGENAEIVCYRDFTGRRLFGMLSDVDTGDGMWPAKGTVSFSVTATEFVETYGALADVGA